MSTITRREFLKAIGVGTLTYSAAGMGFSSSDKSRVVVIGGGFGGATASKYIRMLDPAIDVTLVEKDMKFHTCPFSNTVLGGIHDMAFITHGYDNLKSKHGVKVVHDTVVEIDPGNQSVKLAGGKTLKYDRLILSPGIDFTWDAIEGYDQPASEVMPHAWKAGEQTVNLRDKLQAMPDGGVVVIAPPGNPFRCPPGPYERASLIAHYLKANKPRSKILILDAKEKFSKQALFTRGWEKFYPGMIEWVSLTNGGEVKRVDTKTMTVYTEFDQHKVDVANIIPPQKAAGIAHRAGLTDQSGWCPVNQKTFESSLHAGIHVIGDSCIAGKMPKSGYSANSQAKVCAAAVVALLSGRETGEPSFINTCYSLVSPEYGISVAAVYKLENGSIVGIEGAGGVTPKDSESSQFSAEAVFAEGWYKNITYDMFG